MADYPDIYADGFSITAGPFGLTLTLQRSEPSGEPGPHQDPNATVARIRLSRELAKVMGDQIKDILQKSVQVQASTEVKH